MISEEKLIEILRVMKQGLLEEGSSVQVGKYRIFVKEYQWR